MNNRWLSSAVTDHLQCVARRATGQIVIDGYLLPDEAQVMEKVTLQHIVVTGIRTSKVPVERRARRRKAALISIMR